MALDGRNTPPQPQVQREAPMADCERDATLHCNGTHCCHGRGEPTGDAGEEEAPRGDGVNYVKSKRFPMGAFRHISACLSEDGAAAVGPE
jgi:hypothetical protein